jgi:elongation factor P--beta-lysine ligase
MIRYKSYIKGEDSEECNHEYQDNQESKRRLYFDNKTKR